KNKGSIIVCWAARSRPCCPAGGFAMCGRFTLTTDPDIVGRRFGAPPMQGGGTVPRYNVAPTQTVVTVAAAGERQLEQMRWGLIPVWAKDPSIGSKLINARAETLNEKPAFRRLLGT